MKVNKNIFLLSLVIIGLAYFVFMRNGGGELSPEHDNPLGLKAPNSEFLKYEGRYTAGPTTLFTVNVVEDYLGIVPPFWTSKPYVRQVAEGKFIQAIPHENPERKVDFIFDDAGNVVGLEAYNWVGKRVRFDKMDTNTVLPIDLILSGDVAEGIKQLRASPDYNEEVATNFSLKLVTSYPTKAKITTQVLGQMLEDFPQVAFMHTLRGYAFMALGDKQAALKEFNAAVAIDANDGMAVESVRRLTLAEPAEGEGYKKLFPYDWDALFASPSQAEIDAVKADWASRDLSPKNVKTVEETTIELSHSKYDVRIVEHEILGDKHYGAIMVPQNAKSEILPVVLDARGVDPEYTPRDISNGSQLMRVLEENQNGFIFVIPSFRGETFIINGKSYVSEGNRADGWDGATDDMIALLNVTLEIEPRASKDKIASYGKSRGGSVALLTGIREPRVDLVLSLAGPVDWFYAMDGVFFSTRDVLRDVLRNGEGIPTTVEGGQFYERYVEPIASGRWSLEQTRQSMVAGSPLYFVDMLPKTYAYYGVEDRSVSILNAYEFQKAVEMLGDKGNHIHIETYEGRGHDVEPFLSYKSMTNAMLKYLQ